MKVSQIIFADGLTVQIIPFHAKGVGTRVWTVGAAARLFDKSKQKDDISK